jgi:hypothetical protein
MNERHLSRVFVYRVAGDLSFVFSRSEKTTTTTIYHDETGGSSFSSFHFDLRRVKWGGQKGNDNSRGRIHENTHHGRQADLSPGRVPPKRE